MLVFLVTTLFAFVLHDVLAANETNEATTPWQLYNDGTRKLRDGKLTEAEACLESAVASQNFRVQGPALYNLGEARYREGAEALKKAMEGEAVNKTSNHAFESTTNAIAVVDAALTGNADVQELVAAYQQGRGARKELKAAIEAVQKALGTYGNVLAKWQRAEGDFRSALELHASDLDARTNADLIDQKIAKLVDLQQMAMQQSQGMKQKRDDLNKKLKDLKGRMPDDKGPKMTGKNGDDDDDEGDKPQEPKPEGEEPGPKDGKEMYLTREEASRLLGMLKLDSNRKLALSEGDTGKAPEHKGRDW